MAPVIRLDGANTSSVRILADSILGGEARGCLGTEAGYRKSGALATLVVQYGVHRGGHSVGMHPWDLVSVGVNVYTYQCVLVYACPVRKSLSLFVVVASVFGTSLWEATMTAYLCLSSLNDLFQQGRLPGYLESQLRVPGRPGFVHSTPHERVKEGAF